MKLNNRKIDLLITTAIALLDHFNRTHRPFGALLLLRFVPIENWIRANESETFNRPTFVEDDDDDDQMKRRNKVWRNADLLAFRALLAVADAMPTRSNFLGSLIRFFFSLHHRSDERK